MYTFEKIASLSIGDVFWESAYGADVQFKVFSTPVIDEVDGRRQVVFIGEGVATGKEVEFVVTEGLEHYGPRLYDEPAYIDPRNL